MPSYYENDPNDPKNKRLIPGAGVYLQDQNNAQSAYDRAVAQLTATRAKQQIQSGLGSDWGVDPYAQYGSYQQMLQGQGGLLDASHESAEQRGFFGGGLGNQGETAIRYGNAVSALGFKNQLSDWENQYQQGMGQARADQAAANLAATQGGYDDAYQNQDYTSYGGPTTTSYVRQLQQAGIIPRKVAGPVQRGVPTPPKKPVLTKPTANRLRAGRM
jgi:hypothetical protein